jgi:PAS domain S-box-containing protein
MKRIKKIRQRIDVVFIVLLLVLSSIFYITFKRSQFAKESEQWINHTHQVLNSLERVLSSVVDIETSQRGYIITGNEEYLAPLKLAEKENDPQLSKLRQLLADNPIQITRLDSLADLIRYRKELINQGIWLRKNKGAEEANAFIFTNKGRDVMNALRDLIEKMKDSEVKLLDQRKSASIRHTLEVTGLYVGLSIFVFALVIIFYLYIRKTTTKLSLVNDELIEKNEEVNAINEEMQSTEEQLLTNLDQINLLQKFLEDRERQYRELFENASDIIYELGEDGRLQLFNPSLENLSGYAGDELKKMMYWDLVHNSYKNRVVEFYKNQIKSRKVTSYLELPMVTKSGTKVWIGQNVRMIFSETGWVQKVVVVARNISELKFVQRKLKQSEKLYRLISENTHDFIALNKPTGEYSFVSNAVKDLLDYDPDELIGKNYLEFIHPEDATIAKTFYEDILAGKSVLNMQYRMRKKFGTYIWMESNAKPIFNSSSELTDIQTSARNITYRKKVEEELIKAKEDAEELTKAKSLFLSMMSHEIRTPMNAIIGLTNLLLQELPRPDQTESLKLLKFSGDNLLTIINDILDFSKIEAGKIELENIDFDLFELLSNIKLMLQQRAEDKGISLYFKFDNKVPRVVKGDQVRIAQIITNLVSNAIKFTEKGYVELSVESKGPEEGKHKILLKTKDTGIGIEADKVKLIFESFSQARSDTTRKFGGTGLGLSISKRLLNLMNSEIEVKSKVGEGSEFYFTLLLEKGEVSTQVDATKNNAKDILNLNVNVLLVDDNRVNQIVATNFLKKWGVKVDVADNGRTSLEMVKNKSYHLVLMDIQMPIMDGYEAAREIRSWEDPYFQNIPIIALTAEAMTEIKEQAFASGMNDFITKPFQPEELQSKIFQHTNVAPRQAPNKYSFKNKIDLYAEGDPEFRRELASLIVKNLEDLQQALKTALESDNVEVYNKTVHKVKATIDMLGDAQLTACIQELNERFTKTKAKRNGIDDVVKQFRTLCDEVISGLHEENHSI